MTPDDRWRRVEEICHAALERDSGERAAFLASECGGDEALRREVEDLLAQEHKASAFFSTPVGAVAAGVMLPAARSLTAGTRLGSYEIVAAIGAGGMGEVYRARDTRLNREVALKVLPGTFTQDPDRVARIQREAQVLAALNHPHIAAIYGIERLDGTHFLVLELADGHTLAERLSRGALPIDETIAIARQIAEGLEAAHERGIIHRDLKPSNIGLTSAGDVKILDFGLAKPMDDRGPSAAGDRSPALSPTFAGTQTGLIFGTAPYMSPEQAKGRQADKRSDLWSFGCVLYEMLTGRRAFDAEDVSETLAAVLRSEPDWSTLPRDLTPSLRVLVERCLQKDRRKRIGDASTALFLLEDTARAAATISRPGRWTLGTAAAAVLLGVGIRSLWPAPQPQRIVTRVDVTTPATLEPSEFALSPDGRQIVFAAHPSGDVQHLWLRSFDRTTSQQLAGTEDGTQPFWSPEGRSIGFFAGGRLKRLDLATGTVQAIAAAPWPRGGSWSRGNVIVFSPTTTTGLFRVSSDGGPVSAATQLAPKQYSQRWPQFLPDGRHFLYSSFLGQPATRGLFLASIDGGQPQRLLTGDELGDGAPLYTSGMLLVVRAGALFARRFDPSHPERTGPPQPITESIASDSATFRTALSASDNGVLAHRAAAYERRHLVWIDRGGRNVGAIGNVDDAELTYPSLSRDGRFVAVSRVIERNADIWIVDVARGTLRRLTSNPSSELSPVWSPDGRRIAFRSARFGSFDIFVKQVAGEDTEERPLVVDDRTKSTLDWSSDGRTILYVALDPTTGADLWAVPADGSGKPYAVLNTPFDEIQGHFSPDARWLVYCSNESGRFEVYVRRFPGSGPGQLVSTTGGLYPLWGPSGKELFYVSPDGHMMSVPLTISGDGRSITPGTPTPLFEPHLATGSFITTASLVTRAQYDIAASGRFLVDQAMPGDAPPPISLILNWDALLKK